MPIATAPAYTSGGRHEIDADIYDRGKGTRDEAMARNARVGPRTCVTFSSSSASAAPPIRKLLGFAATPPALPRAAFIRHMRLAKLLSIGSPADFARVEYHTPRIAQGNGI